MPRGSGVRRVYRLDESAMQCATSVAPRFSEAGKRRRVDASDLTMLRWEYLDAAIVAGEVYSFPIALVDDWDAVAASMIPEDPLVGVIADANAIEAERDGAVYFQGLDQDSIALEICPRRPRQFRRPQRLVDPDAWAVGSSIYTRALGNVPPASCPR